MKQLHVTIGERRVHNDQVILFVRPERQEVRANQRIALAPDRGPQLRFALDAMHSLSETVVIAIQPSHGGVGKVALPRRGFENRAFIELAHLGKHLLRHFGRRGIKRGVVHIGSFSSNLFELLDKTYHRSPVRQLKNLLFQGVAQKIPGVLKRIAGEKDQREPSTTSDRQGILYLNQSNGTPRAKSAVSVAAVSSASA